MRFYSLFAISKELERINHSLKWKVCNETMEKGDEQFLEASRQKLFCDIRLRRKDKYGPTKSEYSVEG